MLQMDGTLSRLPEAAATKIPHQRPLYARSHPGPVHPRPLWTGRGRRRWERQSRAEEGGVEAQLSVERGLPRGQPGLSSRPQTHAVTSV